MLAAQGEGRLLKFSQCGGMICILIENKECEKLHQARKFCQKYRATNFLKATLK